MGDRASHLAQAASNRQFAEDLIQRARVSYGQSEVDWAVIVRFYAALHYVEAYLADPHNLHPLTHRERISHLQQVRADADLCLAYEILQDMSEQARYGMRHYTLDEVDKQVLNNYLPRVYRVVLP